MVAWFDLNLILNCLFNLNSCTVLNFSIFSVTSFVQSSLFCSNYRECIRANASEAFSASFSADLAFLSADLACF
jgi:hypothetical protein